MERPPPGTFIAEAPDLPGCAADGANRQQALVNIELVVNDWIETARELGRGIRQPKPANKTFPLKIVTHPTFPTPSPS